MEKKKINLEDSDSFGRGDIASNDDPFEPCLGKQKLLLPAHITARQPMIMHRNTGMKCAAMAISGILHVHISL